jgi:hypothetical protein
MSISANVSSQQITATVGETQIDVSVSGGVGPTGSAGSVGATGPQGPQGATGPAGTTSWTGITDKPTTVAGFAITDAVTTSDSRLTDSREWSAATVTQAEAEAGTSTSRLAFSPLRVFQAVAAWWAGSAAATKLDGIATGATANATDAQLRDRSTHTGLQAAGTITGLAAVATSGAYSSLTGTPTTFTPAAHKATHATGGSDALTAADIGAAASTHTHAASDITSGTIADARLSINVQNTENVYLWSAYR